MLKLFVKDNINGHVHEYGTDPHDALILQEDGSLHYENLQSCTGTRFPEEGYSFCFGDGTVPSVRDPEYDPYIDISGEYYMPPIASRADRIRSMTDEELAKCLLTVDEAGKYCKNLPECEKLLDTPEGIPEEKCLGCLMDWLRQPEEVNTDA